MTPELKKACELVFQEHKTSVKPVVWSRDAFSGRLPFGLSAMAKEILISKNIISFPIPEKKNITRLNPAAADAENFEEAEDLVKERKTSFATSILEDQPVYHANPISQGVTNNNYLLVRVIGEQPEIVLHAAKWYMKPVFLYFMWPACAAIGGAFIAWLIGFIYSKIIF